MSGAFLRSSEASGNTTAGQHSRLCLPPHTKTQPHNLNFHSKPISPPRPPLTVWSSAELRTLFRGGDDIYQVKKVLSQGFPLLPMFWLSETKKTWKIFFCTKMENESDCNCVSGWDNYGSRKNCLGGSRGIRRPGAWTLAAHFSLWGKNWSSWTKLGRCWKRGRWRWSYGWASPTPPESDIKSR